MSATPAEPRTIVVDGRHPLTIEDVVAVAAGAARARLSDADEFRARITRGADFVDRLIAEDGVVYGVSTGYGDSCTVAIPPALVPGPYAMVPYTEHVGIYYPRGGMIQIPKAIQRLGENLPEYLPRLIRSR